MLYIDSMNLRDLQYVLSVAETGKFSEAAKRCYVSQPTLSWQIKKLENELEQPLFERGARGAVLTAFGREALIHMRIIARETELLRESANRNARHLGGRLRLGIIPTAGPYLMPHILPAIRQAYPLMRMEIREIMTASLLPALHSAELDIAILSEPFSHQGLQTAPLLDEEFVIALPPHSPLTKISALSPEMLSGEPILMLEDGNCLRAQTQSFCDFLGLSPDVHIEASSIESLRQMVSVGMGCALLPALAAMGPFAQSSQVTLKPLTNSKAKRQLVFAWRKGSSRGDHLMKFARQMADHLDHIVTDSGSTSSANI